ncbi:glycosyltransferase [Thiococcus pfennigii]|uniref:glycosyltransferase n=1 Tax=Thiococcus pfennigii TaxID=1057 RepID=UPI0019079FE8|nr:glycosyltransferase [Thiococcus pfennigii]MBK1701188.1 glycosyl transferase family 1 [Thiococcus pfennigii]
MLNLSTLEPSADADEAPAIRGLDAAGLRVAIVSDAAPERNGVGAYYRDLAEHLRAAGAQVELVAPRFRAGRWYGGLTLPLPGDPTQKILVPPLSLVGRRLRRLAPHAIVVPTPGPYGLLGMHFAGRKRTALIVGFHTHFERLTDLFPGWRVRARIAQACLTFSNRLLFANSQLVLANTQEMVEIARSIGAVNLDVMGTSIPRRFLADTAPPLNPEVRKVLFAGRLAPEKNLDAIVEAARRLPQIEFQIAGDGPLRDWVLAQAADLPNLRYVGWVRRRQMLSLIDGVDCLALPSKVESFGTIALEAMARGRLVVVSAHCGITSWEPLNRGLFRVRDGETLADVLMRIGGLDRALRERKAQIARTAAREMNERNLAHWLEVLTRGQALTAHG